MQYIISGKNIDVTEAIEGCRSGQARQAGEIFHTRDRSSCDPECREGETEDRDYHPNERQYRQSRAGQR